MQGFLRKKKNKNSRSVQRQQVAARVSISHSLIGTINAISREISDTGMFVHVQDLPRLPKGAHLRVQLLDSAQPEIIFNTRVVRINEEGMGLVFVDYELDGERHEMEKLLKMLGKK